MVVERFHLVSREGRVSAVGQANFGAASPGLSLALSMTEMPAAVARAFWPPFIAVKTRAWFDANVRSGMLGPATIQVALPPEHIGRRGRDKILPDYALIGTLPFRDGDFTPVKTLPAVGNAAGAITFANATATVRMQSGRVTVPGKGDLDATGSELAIPKLGKDRLRGDLHLQLSGPAAALASLSDTPPLSVARANEIDPNAVSGEAQLALDANIPLDSGGAGASRRPFGLP
jgi:uncharacterized protein YhdP